MPQLNNSNTHNNYPKTFRQPMPNKQNAFRQSVISSETCIRTDGGKSNSKLRPTGKANSKDRDNDQQQLKNVAQPSQTKVKAFGNDYGVSRETKYKVTTKIRKKQDIPKSIDYGCRLQYNAWSEDHNIDESNFEFSDSDQHEGINKIKLPQNRCVINAKGKGIIIEKNRQKSSCKQSFSTTHFVSCAEVRGKEKVKQKPKAQGKINHKKSTLEAPKPSKQRGKLKSPPPKMKLPSKKQLPKHKSKGNDLHCQDQPKMEEFEDSDLLLSIEAKNQFSPNRSSTIHNPQSACQSSSPLLDSIMHELKKQNYVKSQFPKGRKISVHLTIERAICLYELSCVCAALKLKRESHCLAVYYLDQMGSYQLYDTFAALILALKMNESQMVIRFCDNYLTNDREDSNTTKGSRILTLPTNPLEQIMYKQSKKPIRYEQILNQQRKMVIALNFKLTIKTVAYWTDAITILWDSFLQDDLASCGMVDTYPFLTFRGEQSHNLSYLLQMLDWQQLELKIYRYPKTILILSNMYLLVRLQLHHRRSKIAMQYLADNYRASLGKNSSMLFCDANGTNSIFGQFLEHLEMDMSQIVECIQQMSQYLHPQQFRIFDFPHLSDYNNDQKKSTYLLNESLFECTFSKLGKLIKKS